MSLFKFSPSDKVLLLGEGNFSFSCCLLKIMECEFGSMNFCNVYTSCYQKELSPTALMNVELLKSKGAEVLLGIDATKLEESNTISSLKFDKIIFNFPHVGGKMKIHLNRELIRNFFISSSNILQPRGQVIVTLCSGQGGTGFEIVKRRWDDTWQIVEQAAHGSFVLCDIENFPDLLFKEYQPVGYRGREQMFCTKFAVIHGFRKVDPPTTFLSDTLLKDIINFHPVDGAGDLWVSYIHKDAFNNNPLSNQNKPQRFVMDILAHSLKKYSDDSLNLSEELSYNTEFNSNQAPCLFKGKKSSLRSSLLQVYPQTNTNNLLLSGLVFQKCSLNFNNSCASCHSVIKCLHIRDVIRDFLANLFLALDFRGSISDDLSGDSWNLFFVIDAEQRKKAVWGDIKSCCVTVDLDIICSCIFKVSVKELWTKNVKFDHAMKKLLLPSLYPSHFTFDICFASLKDLDFEHFYNILHQIPDNLIESVNLLSIYQHVDSPQKSYCFRLIYRSFSKPLHRKLVIEIHQNVVGKLLEHVLDVRVH